MGDNDGSASSTKQLTESGAKVTTAVAGSFATAKAPAEPPLLSEEKAEVGGVGAGAATLDGEGAAEEAEGDGEAEKGEEEQQEEEQQEEEEEKEEEEE